MRVVNTKSFDQSQIKMQFINTKANVVQLFLQSFIFAFEHVCLASYVSEKEKRSPGIKI